MFFLSDEMPFSFEEWLLFGAASGGKAIEDTATGNPLVFLTDLARPLKSLSIPFTPIQQGTGDPSPSNIRPIVPWNGLTVKHGGKNLLNPAWLNFEGESTTVHGITFTKNADGSFTANGENDGSSSQIYFTLTGNFVGDFWICDDMIDNAQTDIYCYNGTKAERVKKWDGTTASDALTRSRHAIQVKLNGEDNIRLMIRVYTNETVNNVKFRPYLVSSTETDFTYEPFVPITETDTSFPSPVYGGTLDAVTGVLSVEYEGHTSTWGEMITLVDREQGGYREGRIIFEREIPVSGQAGATSVNQRCDKAKYQWDDFNGTSHFYTAVQNGSYQFRVYLPSDTASETEVTAMCKLKEPYTIQLTPAQITALVGNNTIWSDADGTMTAVFFKKA